MAERLPCCCLGPRAQGASTHLGMISSSSLTVKAAWLPSFRWLQCSFWELRPSTQQGMTESQGQEEGEAPLVLRAASRRVGLQLLPWMQPLERGSWNTVCPQGPQVTGTKVQVTPALRTGRHQTAQCTGQEGRTRARPFSHHKQQPEAPPSAPPEPGRVGPTSSRRCLCLPFPAFSLHVLPAAAR